MELSRIAQHTAGSIIREMFNRALSLKDKDIISFTVGEPDFTTPQAIIDIACDNWNRGLTHYTPNCGIPELTQAIAEYHAGDLAPDPDTQVLVTCGATEAIQLALFALVNPGDEVIVITPAWPNYFGQIAMVGAVAKLVPAREENQFVPDPADIKAALTDRTKAIIFNSPSNPTGAVIEKETWEELANILADKEVYIISDEVYSQFVYEDGYTSIKAFPALRERIVYINGFSKMFAMTGWRLGYAIAAPAIIRSMTKLHENGASCLPAPSQLAAAYAIKNCTPAIEEMRRVYLRRRDLICQAINSVPGMSILPPKGAFYAFANISEALKQKKMDTKTFCMNLLDETGVVVVPGYGFGPSGDGYIRLTYAVADDKIKEGVGRIGDFVTKSR